MIFNQIYADEFEQVIYCQDTTVGLRAIIAIHSSTLGPALGGCRMWNYTTEEEALRDVLILAKGMTYKASISGLSLGGGKAVIIGDAKIQKTPELLRRFGEFVETLNGHYLTAKDVGMNAEDLKVVLQRTSHVLGVAGLPNSSGDPSIATAWGVYHGMRACAQFAFGKKSLEGLTIALQGLGGVGYQLLRYLREEGACLIGCDIDPAMVARATGESEISIVSPEEIYGVKCDIFSPCALGGSINSKTILEIQARIIAGAANNQISQPEQAEHLMKKGIIYAPDYVINAGGMINVYYEMKKEGYDRERAFLHISQIYHTMISILEHSQREKRSTAYIADLIAEKRIAQAKLGKRDNEILKRVK